MKIIKTDVTMHFTWERGCVMNACMMTLSKKKAGGRARLIKDATPTTEREFY